MTDPVAARAPVINLTGLSKSYGRLQALVGADLQVYPGEVFGFLGPNGSGKTTTIRLLTGFMRPTSGRAEVFGMDSWRNRVAISRDLGFLPDTGGLDTAMTGHRLLDHLTALHGRPATLRDELVARLELPDDVLRRTVRTYSQGMRQKLALVQALQHDPALVILDEPTAGLDPLMQLTFFEIIREFRDRGRTVFMSSHTLSEVERLCDRVGIIRAGRFVAVEEIGTLQSRRIRTMTVTFADGAETPDLTRVSGVTDVAGDGRTRVLTIQGDVNGIIRELARHDVAEITFENASLDDVFVSYYRGRDQDAPE